jgi:transcriptional regulator with XRE-family HTH domain
MQIGHLVRAARRLRGWSQRDLAAAAGVDKGVIARWEGARGSADVARLEAVLSRAGAELVLGLPAIPPDDVGTRYLRASTTRRLLHSLDGDREVLRALERVAWWRAVVVPPEASAGVWLPDQPAPTPLPVVLPSRDSRWGWEWRDEPRLDVTVGPVAIAGLVPVGVGERSEVWVHPPDHPLMASDPVLAARLRGVAQLLDEQAARDEAERRSAAHRDSDVRREHGIVVSRKQFKKVRAPDPSPQDRRDWRLAGEATFDQWLGRRGFERLRG